MALEALTACRLFTPASSSQATASPTAGKALSPTQTARVSARATLIPSATSPPAHPSELVETASPSPSALPTWTGTPPTPTPIAKPYLIEVLDWELVQAESPSLCQSCAASGTDIEAPPGLDIVVVQVFIVGSPGSSAELVTDLVYTEPGRLTCTRQIELEREFCGLVFGQVYNGRMTLRARHTRGGENRLEYLLTFQSWAP